MTGKNDLTYRCYPLNGRSNLPIVGRFDKINVTDDEADATTPFRHGVLRPHGLTNER